MAVTDPLNLDPNQLEELAYMIRNGQYQAVGRESEWEKENRRIRENADPATMAALDDLYRDVPVNGNDVDDILCGLRTGTWLETQQFAPLDYHVPGLIPEGSVILVGPPKVGKSWFVLAAALGIASGRQVLGIDVEQRPVFYLALEDGDRRLQDRCRKLLSGAPIPAAFEYMTTLTPGRVTGTIGAWLDRYAADSPLVILDTLGKVMPPSMQGESAYQRDYRIGSELKLAVDSCRGASLLVNHHDRKAASEDFVENVSGTNGLAGAADTVVVLKRPRLGTAGTIQVTGRDVAEGEYAVSFDGAGWRLEGSSLEEAGRAAERKRLTGELGEESISILEIVNQHPQGIENAELLKLVSDVDPSNVRQILHRLYDSGRIRKLKRGCHAPLERPNLADLVQ